MSETPKRDPIEYLINAMEDAALMDNKPAQANYYEKRKAVLMAITALGKERDELREALWELHVRAESFWALIQGEHGVKLSSDEQSDHNVYGYFAAMGKAEAILAAGRVT